MTYIIDFLKISIHALRGEGDEGATAEKKISVISIHALRGEGDDTCTNRKNSDSDISIHALRGEGDH